MFTKAALMTVLALCTWAVCSGAEEVVLSRPQGPALVVDAQTADGTDTLPAHSASNRLDSLLASAARDLASATLDVEPPKDIAGQGDPLPTGGSPGDVRLVVVTTNLAVRKRWVVPKLPVPPFIQWGRWMEAHKESTHCSLDWMDEHGRWWHTELRAYNQHPDPYRVGEGEFPGTGITIYGVFILPGRTALEDHDVVADDRIEMDYRLIEPMAREYGRHDKRPGDPGTGGDGSRNVGLGGPAFKPTQNSNTYIGYLLRRAGVKHDRPDRAVGWDTKPHFPYSSNAQE